MQRNPPFNLLKCLFVAFLVLTGLKVWIEPNGNVLPQAMAQIPDSGRQRQVMIDEIRKTNQLLTQLVNVLQSHTIKVRVEGTDNKTSGRG